MSKNLKVGVIGVGGIASSHFPGWIASPHTEMVAFADSFAGTLNKVADEQKIDVRYENPLDLVNDPEIDIVDICTPNAYHAPLTIAALKAGKHVICEKPLAPTPADIREMIAARDASGKTLMTAQHFRWDPRARALKAALANNSLGEIYHARAWMLRRNWLPTRPTFIEKRHSGGGPCIDIGVHILDLTLWMMGHPKPVSVTGVTQDKLSKKPGAWGAWGDIPSSMDVEEFAAAFVRFENGATLNLEVSWLLHHNTTGEDMQMWLYGDQGGAHWPNNEIVSSDNDAKLLQELKIHGSEDGLEAHAAECYAFAEAVVEGKPSPVPAEESLHVTTILDGLYRSAAEKREVSLA